MRVGFYSHYPLEFGGGGEFSASNVARYLARRGHEVCYYSDANFRGIVRLTPEAVSALSEGFSYERIPFEFRLPPPFSFGYRALPKPKRFSRDDVSFIITGKPPPRLYLKALGNTKCQAVFLLKGLAMERPLPPNPAMAALQILLRVRARNFRVASSLTNVWFVPLSESLKTELGRIGLNLARVRVIPNGIELPPIAEALNVDSFNVVFAARMERAVKGLDLLVRIVQKLAPLAPDDMRIYLAGSGKDSAVLDVLRSLPRVEVTGFLSKPLMNDLLSRASILLVTSYYEPFSLSTIEGLVQGAKVLTTPASGPSSIISQASGLGEVLSYSASEFVDGILREYDAWRRAPNQAREARLARIRTARALFPAEAMGRLHANLLSEVMAHRTDSSS